MHPCRTYTTAESLAGELRKLGVAAGQSILLHSSMRSLGWVEGGAAAVVASLRGVIGPGGTLVVSAMTPDNSDTSRAYRRQIQGMTRRQRRKYRRAMPAFDPTTTPGTGTGLIAEYVRICAGAVRSTHPQSSFAALGANAERFMRHHADDCHLGEDSPLAELYNADAKILMLGVGYESCTAFHLAEYRYTQQPPRRRYACVVIRDGRCQWWRYEDVVLDDRDFIRIGEALEATSCVTSGTVGSAVATLIPMRTAVDFAAAWLATHRADARRVLHLLFLAP